MHQVLHCSSGLKLYGATDRQTTQVKIIGGNTCISFRSPRAAYIAFSAITI